MTLLNSGNPKLTAQLLTDREKAFEKIFSAFEKADGDMEKTARALKVTSRTVRRWFSKYTTLAQKRAEFLRKLKES